MGALKALVIGMGVLLVTGVVVIVVTLINRAGDGARRSPYATAVAVGSGVLDMTAAEGRIVLRTRQAAGERLVVIDAGSGRLIGTVDLNAGP
jgi:hypothetical protein